MSRRDVSVLLNLVWYVAANAFCSSKLGIVGNAFFFALFLLIHVCFSLSEIVENAQEYKI